MRYVKRILIKNPTHSFPCLANCYSKVKAETTVLQEKMIQELGLDPVDKEIAIVYQGERNQFDDEFFKVHHVIGF